MISISKTAWPSTKLLNIYKERRFASIIYPAGQNVIEIILLCRQWTQYQSRQKKKAERGFCMSGWYSKDCQMLHWTSTKCQRVTHSMVAGAFYAFSLRYDYGFSIQLVFRHMKVEASFIFSRRQKYFWLHHSIKTSTRASTHEWRVRNSSCLQT